MTYDSPRNRAIEAGRAAFGPGWTPEFVAEAPGRLELLGNHVDYNGGLVLAGAIDRVVAIVVGKGAGDDDGGIALLAEDIDDRIDRFSVESCRDWTTTSPEIGPADYAQGVIASLLATGRDVRGGIALSIRGDIPIGFGMSSSAGLCVALVLALTAERPDPRQVVAIAREAEHRCGSPVGAMDQSASVAGEVIIFDGRDASYTAIEPDLVDYVFAVADSGVHHAIGTSSYPVRVAESREALGILRARVDPELGSLGELDPEVWASVGSDVYDRLGLTLGRRVDHIVAEIARVRRGIDAVRASDWETFGQLMAESGQSSNRLYDVSHPKVEQLIAELGSLDGVMGARMMGGGEGGPALALILRDAIPDVAMALDRGYFRRNPSQVEGDRLQVCSFGPGARVIHVEEGRQ